MYTNIYMAQDFLFTHCCANKSKGWMPVSVSFFKPPLFRDPPFTEVLPYVLPFFHSFSLFMFIRLLLD